MNCVTMFFLCGMWCGVVFAQEVLQNDSLKQVNIQSKKEELKKMQQDQSAIQKRIVHLEEEIKQLSTSSRFLADHLSAYANITQSEFSNWVAGGESFISFLVGVDYGLTFQDKPNKLLWDTRFGTLLGFKNTVALGIVKSNDFLSIRSNVSYGVFKTLSASGELYIRSQFFETVDRTNPQKPIVKSSFFSPAYLNLGVGAKWVPKPWLSLYISPLTIQATAIADEQIDPKIYGLDSAQRLRILGGWYINAESSFDVLKFITVNARCILFQNYLAPFIKNTVDVDFRLKIDAKIAKYFYANLFLNLLYDERSKLKTITSNGIDQQTQYSPIGIQVYENLGIGFSYILEKVRQ